MAGSASSPRQRLLRSQAPASAGALFPAASVPEGIAAEFGPAGPLLVRLRIVHPIVAVSGGLLVGWIAAETGRRGSQRTRRLAAMVSVAVLLQFFIGIANVLFLTPLLIQVLHLMVADILWLSFILFSASWRGDPIPVRAQESVFA